jgi:hypothetical protein
MNGRIEKKGFWGHSPAAENGDMGGVDPAGDAGGVLAALLGDAGHPAGRLIMMLRVTFTGVSSPPVAGDGGTNDGAAASPAGSAGHTRHPEPVSLGGNNAVN